MEENQNLPEEQIVPSAETNEATEAVETTATVETIEPVEETVETTETPVVEEIIEEAPSTAKAKKVEEPVLAPDADFDWDAYERGDALSAPEKERLTNIYDNTFHAIKDKEVVEGTVISINKREVVVNVGYKSDGTVPMSEFRYNPDRKSTRLNFSHT